MPSSRSPASASGYSGGCDAVGPSANPKVTGRGVWDREAVTVRDRRADEPVPKRVVRTGRGRCERHHVHRAYEEGEPRDDSQSDEEASLQPLHADSVPEPPARDRQSAHVDALSPDRDRRIDPSSSASSSRSRRAAVIV